MKHAILVAAIASSFVTAPSFAQDKIELYTDFARTQCSWTEGIDPINVTIYVWLTGPVPSTGARFAVPKPDCWDVATWVGDTLNPLHGAPTIGNSQTDWLVGFFAGSGGCIPSHTPPIFIGTVHFVVDGLSASCCEVKAKPGEGGGIGGARFVFTDCSFEELPLTAGQSVVVNPNATCPCQSPTATQPSTWGRVKSLYR